MSESETAILAGGCFWCTEAVFRDVIGVSRVESGYIGGTVAEPTYKQVCGGQTGHAEAIRVTYDPATISYGEILDVFLGTHDPTQLNRQGNDVGTQYRSAVFYHTPEQKDKAEHYKSRLNQEGAYPKPIVTEITPAAAFYAAEDYHQNYYNTHGSQPYCYLVIRPKVEKFEKVFKDKLKKNATQK